MALFQCDCGKRLKWAGEPHDCPKAAKSSRGGGESRPATERRGSVPGNSGQSIRPPKAHTEQQATEAPAGPRVGSRIGTDGVAPVPRETKSKGGRPLAKDADKALSKTKPWAATGMSRASWYRRKAEGTLP